MKVDLTRKRPIRTLSADEMRQIDGWIEWWLDTDTWFGLLNQWCAILGALGGFGWAVVAAFKTGVTFVSIIVLPVVTAVLGMVAGALAPAAGVVYVVARLGMWLAGLL